MTAQFRISPSVTPLPPSVLSRIHQTTYTRTNKLFWRLIGMALFNNTELAMLTIALDEEDERCQGKYQNGRMKNGRKEKQNENL